MSTLQRFELLPLEKLIEEIVAEQGDHWRLFAEEFGIVEQDVDELQKSILKAMIKHFANIVLSMDSKYVGEFLVMAMRGALPLDIQVPKRQDRAKSATLITYLLASSQLAEENKTTVLQTAVEEVVETLGHRGLTNATIWLFINHDADNQHSHLIIEALLKAQDLSAQGAVLDDTVDALNMLAFETGAVNE